MITQQLDDKILTLKKEQLTLSSNYEQLQERMNQMRIRFAQITGGVAVLEELKKELNGSEPPPP